VAQRCLLPGLERISLFFLSNEWPTPNVIISPHSASPIPMTSGKTFGPTGWPGTGGTSQPP